MPPVSLTRDGIRADDAALNALFAPFASGELSMPPDGNVLFIGARPSAWMHQMDVRNWICVQPFKPHADALLRHVSTVEQELCSNKKYALVLLLPARQRDYARAMLAQALDCVSDAGCAVVSIANNEGARSGQNDFEQLAGPLQQTSKHKCRVFWTTPESVIDHDLQAQWRELDRVQTIDGDWLSRPGLFAWNRVDPASALLASHLPSNLHGSVADLGAGFGYLSAQALRMNPAIREITLYEADARALQPARDNLKRVATQCSRADLTINTIWHDVTQGLPTRHDAIISNPPFHEGRADLPGLGQRFIEVAANALQADGQLWLVANRHLPYESTLHHYFSDVQMIDQQAGFKVFHANGVRR